MEDKAQSTRASTQEETWYFKGIHLNTNVKIMYVRVFMEDKAQSTHASTQEETWYF